MSLLQCSTPEVEQEGAELKTKRFSSENIFIRLLRNHRLKKLPTSETSRVVVRQPDSRSSQVRTDEPVFRGVRLSDCLSLPEQEFLCRHPQGSEEPFFVLNLDGLYERHLRWRANLPRVKPFYSVKCNSSPAVIRMLKALDAGFDCASKGEIQSALSLGVTPDKIIYAHTIKPQSHIRCACAHGIDLMTFDNEEELLKISRFHAKARLVLRIMVDDTNSVLQLSSKFGAKMAAVDKLLERAAELGLNVTGVSFHVGSKCTDTAAFRWAIADARHVFDIANARGFHMSLLDIGGGLPGRDDYPLTFEEFSEVINGALEEFFPPESGVQVIAEPGRYYVESVFTLAVSVIAKRVDNHDAAEDSYNEEKRKMVYYISDGVYGSMSCILTEPVTNCLAPYLPREVESSEQKFCSVIWGPTCDSIDKVFENYWLPQLDVGDWLLIDNMGAYSVSLMTDFNGFGRARVYPVVTEKLRRTFNLSR
ncbi:ornithine decarboxylase-like [Aulostomus maculatus]